MVHRADDTPQDAEVAERLRLLSIAEKGTLAVVIEMAEKWGKRLAIFAAAFTILGMIAVALGFSYTSDREAAATLVRAEHRTREAKDSIILEITDSLARRVGEIEQARAETNVKLAALDAQQDDIILLLCNMNLSINPRALRICVAKGAAR